MLCTIIAQYPLNNCQYVTPHCSQTCQEAPSSTHCHKYFSLITLILQTQDTQTHTHNIIANATMY